jgi:hypothetical protein
VPTGVLWEILRERNQLAALGIDGRILTSTFIKKDWGSGLD